MSVQGISYANVGAPQPVETKAYRRAQEEPKTTVNFEGRQDYDSFEKKGSNTAKNVAIGTGIAAAALYITAAILGKKGVNIKDAKNFLSKGYNATIDGAYKSAKWLKDNTWGRLVKGWDNVKNYFQKKGGNQQAGAAGAGNPPAGATGAAGAGNPPAGAANP